MYLVIYQCDCVCTEDSGSNLFLNTGTPLSYYTKGRNINLHRQENIYLVQETHCNLFLCADLNDVITQTLLLCLKLLDCISTDRESILPIPTFLFSLTHCEYNHKLSS